MSEIVCAPMEQKKMTKGKTAFWVILILLLVFLVNVVLPRVGVRVILDIFVPDIGAGAEYFTEYDVRDDDLVMTSSYIDIGVPQGYVKFEYSVDADVYKDPHKDSTGLIIMPPGDVSFFDLYNRDIHEDMSDSQYKFSVLVMNCWFEALGNGAPDSGYDTMKCMYLLDENERGFWNIGKNIAFGIVGTLRECALDGDDFYVYETADKCGIIVVKALDGAEDDYYVIAEMYSKDDLNTCYTVMINSSDLEQIYAVINSITIK